MLAARNDASLLHDGAELLRVAQRKPAGNGMAHARYATGSGKATAMGDRTAFFLCKPWCGASGDG